jgi:ADP-ribose pyrophosphatase
MRKVVYKNRYLSIERETCKVRGKENEFFRLVEPDVVVIVPLLLDGRFLMERQYRHPIRKWLYEFPAGHIERGETPKAAAVRELEEETGYRAAKIAPLPEFYWTPGSGQQRYFFFHATVDKKGKRSLDDTEEIRLVKIGAATLEKMVHGGRIRDGMTALAFLLYSKYF